MTSLADAPPLAWERLLEAGDRDERLVTTSVEPARGPRTVAAPAALSGSLAAALLGAGISELYAHQVEALEAAREGDVIVTSGTASGKSLSFNLPVLDAIATDPKTRALYIYPTKALAQDQARKLSELALPELRHAIYDGDTPRDDRPAIRRRSNLVLTNPDMLNMALLAHHKGWGDFLANLGWVVVDEAHTYRGVFGSHVANVLRRLRRVARVYGSEPRFICASATIANPLELAGRLVGTEFTLVDSDGAPRAKRRIAIWNPPVIDPKTMHRRSVLSEAAELLADLVINGSRTICFLKSRRGIELIQRFTRMRLQELGEPGLAARIAPYRGGYTPQQRRAIEADLARGELLAVVTTDALELGIDIGELDAAICVTFPGTVASLRQMWGRAGRRSEGIALYVAGEDALDQFFCRHPEEFLARPVEAAILDHTNERIQTAHLLAAAYEAPLGGTPEQPGGDDDAILGDRWRERADALVGGGQLRRGRDGRYLPRGPGFPAGEISLRSASLDSIAVVDRTSGELIGQVEAERAFSTIHPGAIYLHLGRSYEVAELDLDSRRAIVDPFDGDWYTQPKKETEVFIESVGVRREIGAGRSGRRRALLRRGLGDRAGDRLPAQEPRRPLGDRPHRARAPGAELPHPGALVPARRRARRVRRRSRRRSCSGRCTQPSTARSRSCRCWRCATAGTSAASRRTSISRPGCPRSSSTTATPAGSGSRGAATTSSSAWSPTQSGWWGSARARAAVRRACRAPSAGT